MRTIVSNIVRQLTLLGSITSAVGMTDSGVCSMWTVPPPPTNRIEPHVDLCRRTVRLSGVVGDGEKANDLLFCGDLHRGTEHVIYFGGDVQDFRENMLAHRDNKRQVQWCFEETALLLQKRFPDANIWIIRPCAMYLKTMSVFCNFVESSGIGIPTFSEDHGALRHLVTLLGNGIKGVNHASKVSLPGDDELGLNPPSVDSDVLPVRLVGFSKGCVVLNQMIHELPLAQKDPPIKSIVSRLKAFYWLDGGHAGEKDTWLTDRSILKKPLWIKCRTICPCYTLSVGRLQ